MGYLPLGCAAICNASISVQRLSVEAAVHADIRLLRQAMLMDPLVGAVCNPREIYQMVDEMLIAESQWLPQYHKETEGAARLHTKTVEEMAADKEASRKLAAAADKADHVNGK